MADIDIARKPGGQYSTILMLVAILSVVGLMAWLAMESSRRQGMSVNEEAAAAAPRAGAAASGDEIAFETVSSAPAQYDGQTVTIASMPIAAALGPRVLWSDVSTAEPFLVVVPEGTQGAAPGRTITATGTVTAVTPEIVDQWEQSGAMDAGSREVAVSAPYFLQVTQVLESGDTPPAP
jgi:hypothetical protein